MEFWIAPKCHYCDRDIASVHSVSYIMHRHFISSVISWSLPRTLILILPHCVTTPRQNDRPGSRFRSFLMQHIQCSVNSAFCNQFVMSACWLQVVKYNHGWMVKKNVLKCLWDCVLMVNLGCHIHSWCKQESDASSVTGVCEQACVSLQGSSHSEKWAIYDWNSMALW